MSTNALKDLESNNPKVFEDFKASLNNQFNHSREPALMNGLYDYYLITNSLRVVDVIVTVKEPHDNFFFERSYNGIRSDKKLPHLTLLGYIVRKQPIWLVKIGTHNLLHELLRLLQNETDIVTVVSALLIINILLPLIPGRLGVHLVKLFAAFSKLAAVNTNSNNIHEAQLVHLQISLYTLFHRLYGMFPCSFVSYLHKEYSTNEPFPVFSHTVKPMFDTVRVNPLLITANPEWEQRPERWKNIEPHDIIINCAKLLMSGSPTYDANMSAYEAKSAFNCKTMLGALKVTDQHTVTGYCTELSRKGEEVPLWSPSICFSSVKHPVESTPTMIPLTPIARGFEVSSPYSEHEGSSPPEAAVEATPETTPVRDYVVLPRPKAITLANRSLDSFTKESAQGSKVPTSDRSFPSSPIKKKDAQQQFRYSAPEIQPLTKVDKLLNDRHQMAAEEDVIEVKTVGAIKHDLSTNFHRHDGNHKMISTTESASSARVPEHPSPAVKIPVVDDRRQMNGTVSCAIAEEAAREGRGPEVADSDYEACELEQSGSPCTAGGLHLPDHKSLKNFAQSIRTRYYHAYSESGITGGCSTGTSPQDANHCFADTNVHRANSWPEMKRCGPSGGAFGRPRHSVLEERDDDDDEESAAAEVAVAVESVGVVRPTMKVCSGTQTDDSVSSFQFPYEHLFLEVFPPLHSSCAGDDHVSPTESENSLEERVPTVYERVHAPSKILQKYIDSAVHGYAEKPAVLERLGHQYDSRFLTNQLKLMSVQLQFEEHRREIHAERNRRLLGRSRRNKTLEEYNSALKDQVLLLQKELETNESQVVAKKADMENQLKLAMRWEELYSDMEKKFQSIVVRCEEIESQLKEEKKLNVNHTKSIFEARTALVDVTNELKANQKEARAAKDLRVQVSELQAGILKAGELIVRHARRLTDYLCMPPEGTEHEMFQTAYVEEVRQLKALHNQSVSVDANRTLIADLRIELQSKENAAEESRLAMQSDAVEWRKQLKELKEKYDAMKTSYNRELERCIDLDYKLNNAKRVNRLSQSVPRPKEFPGMSRYAGGGGGGNVVVSGSVSGVVESSASGSSVVSRTPGQVLPDQGGLKPLKHGSLLVKDAPPSGFQDRDESAAVATAAAAAAATQERVVQLQRSRGSVDVFASYHESATAAAAEPDSGHELMAMVKRRGRMECAESGQLRSSSHGDGDGAASSNAKKPPS